MYVILENIPAPVGNGWAHPSHWASSSPRWRRPSNSWNETVNSSTHGSTSLLMLQMVNTVETTAVNILLRLDHKIFGRWTAFLITWTLPDRRTAPPSHWWRGAAPTKRRSLRPPSWRRIRSSRPSPRRNGSSPGWWWRRTPPTHWRSCNGGSYEVKVNQVYCVTRQ